MHDARCRDMNLAIWHPVTIGKQNPPADNPIWKAAKAICARCPVVTECLDHALLTRQPDGVWGGLTPSERKRYQPQRETGVALRAREAA